MGVFVIAWNEGQGTVPARSVCLSYQIVRLASPALAYMAEHRPSLFQRVSVGPSRESLGEAKADAEAHYAKTIGAAA